MSEVIVVAFDNKHRADEVVLDVLNQDSKVIEGVEDAVARKQSGLNRLCYGIITHF